MIKNLPTRPSSPAWEKEDSFLWHIVQPAFERATDGSPLFRDVLDNPRPDRLEALAKLAQMVQGGEEIADRLPLTSQIVLYSLITVIARLKWNKDLMEQSSGWIEVTISALGWNDLLEGM